MRRHRFLMLAALVSLILSVVILPGCAATQAHPAQPAVTSLRAKSVALVDTFTIAVGIADEAGQVADSLPIPVATKDKIDCAIKKALGDDAVSAVVVRICGPGIPSAKDAPLRVAIRTLGTVIDQPSLNHTVQVALDVSAPIWDALAASGNPRLAALGRILQLTLKPASSMIGGRP
jgi:hypothetical protein